ncbi:MAG: glycosyltransferase [Candidatus Omnitrophota bacterium]
MKILIVIRSLACGGAEKQAIMDANALNRRGHRLTVAFHQGGELVKLLDPGISIYRIHSANLLWAFAQLGSHFLFHRYDIIHAHMCWAERIAAFSGRMFGQPIILNEHSPAFFRRWYHRFLLRLVALSADRIITCCEATRNDQLSEGIKPEKLVTIFNSFDPALTVLVVENQKEEPEENEIEKDNRNIGNNSFTVGFTGRFSPVKRLGLYIPLALRLRDVIPGIRFVLVGDGRDRGKIEAAIRAHHLDDLFVLPGFVLQPWLYLETFDIFFLPSRIEAFSVALLEAGALAIPSIAFAVGGNPELIQNGVTGCLLPDHDISAVAETIIDLYRNPDKRARIGTNAQRFVTETFSIETRIDRLERLYAQRRSQE